MMLSRRLSEMASSPRARGLGSAATTFAGILVCAAIVGMFFSTRYPVVGMFAKWVLLFYVGTFVTMMLGLVVIGPGVFMAKEMYEAFSSPEDLLWARRLTLIWCAGAGALLSLLLGAGLALIVFGPVTEVKLWFIGLCWAVLMVPWALVGLLGRWVFRRISERKARTTRSGVPGDA